MSDIDLKQLRELAAKATPGPWRAGAVEKERVFVDTPKGEWLGHERVLLRMNVHFDNYAADAAFIAAADPTTVWALLDEIRTLRAQFSKALDLAAYPEDRQDEQWDADYRALVEVWRKHDDALDTIQGTPKATDEEMEADDVRF